MKTLLLSFGMIASMILLFSCEKSEEEVFATPYAKINGTWKVESTKAFGRTFPGDGSSLTFNDCSNAPCSGTDYLASDKSSGNFTYTIASDQKSISIVDHSGEGGAFNGKWDILVFEKSSLRISSESIFGTMVIELKK
jgi:hypothetical protein